MKLADKRASRGGWRLSEGAARAVRTSPAGRVCREPSCKTKLSIYNDGPHCSQHRVPATVRRRESQVLLRK